MKYSTKLDDIEQEVEIDFFRASGLGGQNVNKRETAVRLRHIPSGLVVVVQSERTQGANREIALTRLQKKLERLNRPNKKRFKTKVPRREREKRLREKHQHSELKNFRKPPEASDKS